MAGEHFASGNWRVKEGSEREFIARWQAWLSSSAAAATGFGTARLLQDPGDALHFMSFSDWESPESRESWKSSPEFAEGMAQCRELCDDFQGTDFSQVASV